MKVDRQNYKCLKPHLPGFLKLSEIKYKPVLSPQASNSVSKTQTFCPQDISMAYATSLAPVPGC